MQVVGLTITGQQRHVTLWRQPRDITWPLVDILRMNGIVSTGKPGKPLAIPKAS